MTGRPRANNLISGGIYDQGSEMASSLAVKDFRVAPLSPEFEPTR
jgi:hypothetical protein